MTTATKSTLPERRLLNEAETAHYIGMSRGYLRKARMEGMRERHTPAPPYIQISRTVRYDLADLDAWILEHRVDPRRAER